VKRGGTMKMPVMEQLHKDHINYSKLLDSLETYLEELRQGGDKGYLEMRQIMDYMTRYPDIFHHPYEDIIFDEACKQEGDLVPLISDLISEHRKLKTASVTLCEDLDAVISGHIVEKKKIWNDTSDYIALLRDHMNREECEVFPKINEVMTVEHWDNVRGGLDHVKDPIFGEVVSKEFKSLYDKIIQV
jgi:hemerythrin-like domain-containing protein